MGYHLRSNGTGNNQGLNHPVRQCGGKLVKPVGDGRDP